MKRIYAMLPAVAAVLLFAAPAVQAATGDANMEWQTYEQAYGSNMAPKTDADCAKYVTDEVKNECMNRMHGQPTFTYHAADSRGNADQAAIRYCTKLGKTYEKTGEWPDRMTITYTCK